MEDRSTHSKTRPAHASPVLLLLYHFAPSAEIGARRCTAVARDLAGHGIPSVVVSAFGGIGPNDAMMSGKLMPVWVRERKPHVMNAMIAAKRAAKGFLSKVCGSEQGHPPDTLTSVSVVGELQQGNLIVRIATLLDRTKRWSFVAALRASAEGRTRGARAVMASGPPMSSLVAATWVARRLDIPLLLDLRDPWFAGSDLEDDGVGRFEARIGRFLERIAFKRAAAIVTATEGMAHRIRLRYPEWAGKVHVVRNGFDGETCARMTSTAHRLDILFAGEIYLYRDPMPILRAIARLLASPSVDESRVTVTLIGQASDEMRRSLLEWVGTRHLEAVVRILPPVPFETILRMTAHATVLLNLSQNCSLAVPAKSYEQIASGREVLLVTEQDSDVGKLFGHIGGVSFVDSSDEAQLDAALADLYHRHVIEGNSSPPTEETIRAFSRDAQQDALRAIFAGIGVHPID